MTLGCACVSHRDGWSHVGDQMWVHPECGQPSPANVRRDMASIELQYFYRGPLHNTLVTASDLIHTPRAGITEYKWTTGVMTGSESGRKARVWMHESTPKGDAEVFISSLSQ